jgi:L-threonylcarbamoyladenylate synthase
MVTCTVDAEQPNPASIEEVARILRRGGVALIPTDTFYGLAANPFDSAAVRRVFAIKERRDDAALPLIAADIEQMETWLGGLPESGRRLADRFWPGPLTLVVAASKRLAAEVTGGLPTVGVRVPAHAAARALCGACGHPLTATSANISGEPASADPASVRQALGRLVDALLDAGVTPGGAPSTLVDVTRDEPVLIRAGAIAWDRIHSCLQRG